MTFHQWLERRDPALRPIGQEPQVARRYAASLTDPILLARVQRSMEAESDWMRKQLGMKRDRRTKRRPGL
jgi:hypothetical protein